MHTSARAGRLRRWGAGLLAVGLMVSPLVLGASSASASGNHGILPPRVPAANWVAPTHGRGTILEAITLARAQLEHIGPLRFDVARYNRLSIPEQMFVLVNLERLSRGEVPAYGLYTPLNAVALGGALNGRDPVAPANANNFHSIWASTMSVARAAAEAADFGWMYEDGPPPYFLSYNIFCPHRGAWGCWGHRNAILEPDPSFSTNGVRVNFTLLAGSAGALNDWRGQTSLAMSFAWYVGVPRSGVTYTWAQAVKFLGLPKSDVPVPLPPESVIPTTTTSTTTTTVPVTPTTAPVVG